MKITDREFNIKEIISVSSGTIPVSKTHCDGRLSDCFVYVLSGYADYTFGKKTCRAESGDIIYLSYKSLYAINIPSPDYRFIFIDFFFDNQSPPLENDIYKAKDSGKIENMFYRFLHLWTLGSFSNRILCKSVLYAIYSEAVSVELTEYIPNTRRQQLEAAVKKIEERCSDASLSVRELAAMCGISEVHFRRMFAMVYHTSPLKFINSLRLHNAKQLLSYTKESVSDIAAKCGFSSAYYFGRVFKSNVGITPGEYRKMPGIF